MRYPTAPETERVCEALDSRPRTVAEIARRCRIPGRRCAGALKSLLYQRRAMRTAEGWRCPRRREE